SARGDHQGGPAGEGQVALPAGQGPRREVQGDQGGGAGGVDGHRWALEAEGVGDASGGHAGGRAGADVPVEPVQSGGGEVAAVVEADVDAGGAAAEAAGGDAGAFDGLPGGAQQQPLLGVHGAG